MAGIAFKNSPGQGVAFSSGPSAGIAFGTAGAGAGVAFSGGGKTGGGTAPGVGEKIGGFLLSTVESFPELFGIEPSEMTQVYRAQNPVGGFASQMVGAFAPYVGAAKLVRAVPLLKAGIGAVEGLGSSALARGALGAAAETALVEAGRLGISATPLPELLYSGATGRDPEMKGLGTMAGEGLVNIVGGAALGAVVGGLAGRFAKGRSISDLTGMDYAEPLTLQKQKIDEMLATARDPANPKPASPEIVLRLEREAMQLRNFNLLDVEPKRADTGETLPGPLKYEFGKPFSPLVGDKKSVVTNFLNRVATGWQGKKLDNLTSIKRVFFDPKRVGVYQDEGEFTTDMLATGLSDDASKVVDTIGTWGQDAKVISVREGVGKPPEPKDYTSPLDWIREKTGEVKDFYHGTASDIEQWKPGARGGISFSTDPSFASAWALMKEPMDTKMGAKVYVTAIRAAKGKTGNYSNQADVMKAIEAAGLDPENPALQANYKTGNWEKWENLQMLKKAGWDTVYMTEAPGGPRNLFVTNGENIYSAFDPKVKWAKNIRLLASEPQYNKPTSKILSPAGARAKGLQKRFTSKLFVDVGDGWRQGVDENAFSIMVKKIKGGVDPEPGDRWLVLRTANPEKFAVKSAKFADILDKSGYYPKAPDRTLSTEPLMKVAQSTLKLTDNVVVDEVMQAKTKAGAMLRDVRETARTYLQPTVFLMQRKKLAAQGFELLKSLQRAAEGRVQTLMLGEHTIDPESKAAGIFDLRRKASGGIQKRIEELDQQDINDIQFVLEDQTKIEAVRAANQRKDLNGNPLISDKALEFLEALNYIDNAHSERVTALHNDLKLDTAIKLLNQFKTLKGHYGMTRDFTGSYRIYLTDEAGEIVGLAPGKDWVEAEENAAKTIAHWAGRGKKLFSGGRIDETMRTTEDLAKLKGRISKPGFLKSRIGLLGYETNRGAMTNRDLSKLVSSNLARRENFLRDIVADDQLAPIRSRLELTSAQDANRLEDARKIMAGDEGSWAKAQNAVADKVLASVGLTGSNSATKIVQATQKIMSSFQFNFGNITQPVTQMTGIFQTLLPQIAFIKYASGETLARTHSSLPLLDGAGNLKGNLRAVSEVKVLMSAFQRLGVRFKDQPQDYQEMVELLTKQRVMHPRFTEADMGTDGSILSDPISAFKSTKNFVEFISSANSLLISKADEMARLVAVNAAYDLGKTMGLNPQRMALFARDLVNRTNYSYGAMDRAKVFTTPIGTFAGTFKNWMFHYMSSMLGYANAGREGIPALMWQTAATGLLGGAVAAPLVVPMADAASKFFTDHKFMENLYAATGALGMDERVADGVMYGLPGVMGVSLASQISSPGSDPQRDAQMIFGFAAFDRMKSLSTGVKDALTVARTTGESPWEDANVRGELVRALAPRTIYRMMAMTQDMAVKSLATGYDVTHPMGLGSAALYAAGFSTVELEKTYEVYNEIRNGQREQKQVTQELGATLAQAWDSNDDRLANRTYTRALALGVDTSSVLRSAEARTRRGEETQLDFAASPEDEQRFEFMFNGN